MGKQGGTRAVACVAAALLAGALSACNGGSAATVSTPSGSSSGPAQSDKSATSPSSGSSAPSGSTSDQDRILAKVIAHAPPKDLLWMVPKAPSAWKRMPGTSAGQNEWNAGDRCVVFLDQPGGIGTQQQPDSKAVLRHTVDQTGLVLDGKPKATYVAGTEKKRFVANVVEGLNSKSSVSFEGVIADYGKGRRGRFLAYRNGDFALTFTGVCGTSAGFGKHDKEFQRFIGGLKAHTTY